MSASSTFPAPVYREEVLRHIFADAQRLFLPALLEVDKAHLVMLAEQGIIPAASASACADALVRLDLEELRREMYDGSVEDLFFLLERRIAAIAGAEHSGRLHTARSRNDIDLTMYRMFCREQLLQTLDRSLDLRQTLLSIAVQHSHALMPAYTHNQPAQPTTLGHYMMAMVEVLERDTERMIASYGRLNRSPLGACAITTTGFPIQRQKTAELLGFRGLVVNSYGAIAAVDYLAELCGVLAASMLSLGRFTQDMLSWSTAEVGFLRLSDGYVQISSIMPQKRNPVPLEHTRILASRALTESQAVVSSLHNTPFADMNDAEDSLQPLVALAFSDAQRAIALLAGALGEATFHIERMHQRARQGFLTVTEAADTLVRETGITFHDAHQVVSEAVRAAASDDLDILAHDLFERCRKKGIVIQEQVLRDSLDPARFVARRTVAGGPAPDALDPELDRAQSQLDSDRSWIGSERTRLARADGLLQAACLQLQEQVQRAT